METRKFVSLLSSVFKYLLKPLSKQPKRKAENMGNSVELHISICLSKNFLQGFPFAILDSG